MATAVSALTFKNRAAAAALDFLFMHEKKNCPGCGHVFECKPGNITQCQCYGILLSEEIKAYMEQQYNDCLCRDCLEKMNTEFELFKEKFIYR